MDMAMVNRFLEKDIPYGKLANLGIDREKTLSMPKDLLESLMSGKVTPLVQAHVRSESGITLPLIKLSNKSFGIDKVFSL